MSLRLVFFFFFFNDTATTEIYTLSLHDALPISRSCAGAFCSCHESLLSTVMFGAWRSACQQAVSSRANSVSSVRMTDRKSTRLNSSHQIISYAVFCLKKKKKANQATIYPGQIQY